MSLDTTTASALLKQHYIPERIESEVYKDNPLLGLTPKKTDFGGSNLPVPVIYGNPQAGSATFATAQTASTSTNTASIAFLLTRIKEYALATISNEVIKASKGKEDAFVQALTTEVDGAINVVKRALGTSQYRAGWGDIGVIDASTTLTGAVLVLATPDDVVNFEVNMICQFSSAQSTAVLRNSGATLTVSGVDRSSGKVTFSANLNTVTGIATGDFVFRSGDRQNSATPSRLKIAGLEAWCPATKPAVGGGDSFFGVDRSADAVRLAGGTLDGTKLPLEEALVEAAMRVGREGYRLSHYFMSFKSLSALDKALGAKVQYVELKQGQAGFDAMKVVGPKGSVMVVGDQNCPANRIYGLNLDYLVLHSLGDLVSAFDEDGLDMIRQSSSDGYEVRWTFYGNQYCRAPASMINIQV